MEEPVVVVKKKIIRQRREYTIDDVSNAVLAVQSGMSKQQASKLFNIPRTTLLKKVNGETPLVRAKKKPLLGWDFEKELESTLLQRLDKGYKIKSADVAEIAFNFASERGKQVFPKGIPGKKWSLLFLRRHPELAERLRPRSRPTGGHAQQQPDGLPLAASSRAFPDEVEVIAVQPGSDDLCAQDSVLRSPPPLLWCGQEQEQEQPDPGFFCAENLVECELRPSSPLQSPQFSLSVSPTEVSPLSVTQHNVNNLVQGVKTLLRPPSERFVGRTQQQQQLVTLIQNRPKGMLFSAVITGPAGVGKTELVLRSVVALEHFHHIIWVSCDNPVVSFQTAARLLGLSPHKHLVQGVFTVCSTMPTLLVYDNATTPKQLQLWLPPGTINTSNIVMLITSQYTEWDCNFHMALPVLEPHEGVQFLLDHLANVPTDIAKEVSSRLNHVPLMLQLVVAYKQAQMNLESQGLLAKSTHPHDFLMFQLTDNEKLGYTKPLMEVLNQSLKQVKESDIGEVAMTLLYLIAFTDPTTAHFDPVLLRRVQLGSCDSEPLGEEMVHQVVELLLKHSLLQIENCLPVMYRIYKAILRAICKSPQKYIFEVMRVS